MFKRLLNNPNQLEKFDEVNKLVELLEQSGETGNTRNTMSSKRFWMGEVKNMGARIKTTWEIRTYDVWGNATNGYEVNDSFNAGEVTIFAPVTVYNPGTPQEFAGASPTDKQIRDAFGIARVRFETDGDDLHIYVNRSKDGYPIGEMFCTSHASLSPINKLTGEV